MGYFTKPSIFFSISTRSEEAYMVGISSAAAVLAERPETQLNSISSAIRKHKDRFFME
jgi:hypothetical protein